MSIRIVSHNFTGNSLVVAYVGTEGFKQKIVESSHPNWRQVVGLYKSGKYEEMIPLFDVRQAINAKFNGAFQVVGDSVTYNGQAVKGYLFDRILFFMREGLPFERLVRFAENLWNNPLPSAREELFKFLEHKHMPITDDGCFLAYKGVQSDFYSITGGSAKVVKGKVTNGKIFNGVGEYIEVARESVDSNRNNGCSYGLHAGSYNYANDFKGSGGRLMVVKINPKDVVSVPLDCNCQKLRTCAYEVIAEDGKVLNEVRDSNYDKVAKVRYANNYSKRDSKGRFTKFNRNSLGRFCK